MRMLLFLLFSSIEFGAGLTLILSLFRFPLRGYTAHIAFASIILAQASFLLNVQADMPALAPILQVIMFILFLWLMFRVQIFYSAIMVTMGYVCYIVIQSLLIFLFDLLNVFTIEEAIKNKNLGYLMQVVTSVASFIICWLLTRYRIGFSFVPDSERERITLKGQNFRFIMVMFLAAIAITISYLFLVSGIIELMIIMVVMAVILGLLLFLAMKKESEA